MALGSTEFEYDREATRAAYNLAPFGGADTCSCAGCRNFRLVRASGIYSPDFLSLLDKIGIDFMKEEEVFFIGDLSHGSMLYGGWFYFVGGKITPAPSRQHAWSPIAPGDVQYRITEIGPAARESFAGYPTIAVDFLLYAPWRLEEEP